jgi:hypothetical protein
VIDPQADAAPPEVKSAFAAAPPARRAGSDAA